MKRLLIEALVIVVAALAIGTGVHVARGDKKAKIPFVGTYLRPYDIRRTESPAPSTPGAPTAVEPIGPASPPPADAGPPAPAVDGPAPPTVPAGAASVPEPVVASEPGAGAPAESGGGPGEPEPPPFVDPDGIITEIDVAAALEHFENQTVFLDARRTRNYVEGHIAGARGMSVWEGDFDERFTEFLNEANIDDPYVVYCMSKNCEDSHILAERMKGAGFTRILVMRGGFPVWKAAGHPIEAGPERGPEE